MANQTAAYISTIRNCETKETESGEHRADKDSDSHCEPFEVERKESRNKRHHIRKDKVKHVTKTRAREPVKRNRAENVQLDLGGLSGGVEVLEEFLLETTMNRSTCHWRTESVLKSTLKGKNDTKEMNVSF